MLTWVLLSIPAGAVLLILWCVFLNKVLYPPKDHKPERQLSAE